MASTTIPKQALANIGSLTNKVAVITGASSGLGRAIASAYAEQGAFIVNADITPHPPKSTPILDETLKSLGSTADTKTPTVELLDANYPVSAGDGANGHDSHAKQRAVYVKCDVTVPEDVENAIKKAVEVFGRLDIMVRPTVFLNFCLLPIQSILFLHVRRASSSMFPRDHSLVKLSPLIIPTPQKLLPSF